MELKNERELDSTRRKLRGLEEVYEKACREPIEDEELREAELESLMRTINQFKGEIARYEARQGVWRE
jgi:hypothetical protein